MSKQERSQEIGRKRKVKEGRKEETNRREER